MYIIIIKSATLVFLTVETDICFHFSKHLAALFKALDLVIFIVHMCIDPALKAGTFR